MTNNFKLDKAGVRTQILQASWMKDYINGIAESKSDSDHHVKTFTGFDRAKSIIYPNTRKHES